MKRPPAWLTYTVLRLLFFAVPFAVLYASGVWWWLSAVIAALFSLSLSMLVLTRLRNEVAAAIDRTRREGRTPTAVDEDVEDALGDDRKV